MPRQPPAFSSRKPSPVRGKPPSSQEHLLYGIFPVMQALRHQRRDMRHLYLKEDAHSSERLNEIFQLAKQYRVPVEFLPKSKLDTLCPAHPHQGTLLSCGPIPQVDESTFQQLLTAAPQLFVALDQVEDPHNLGAILRSCCFFNVSGVITGQAHFSGITPVVSKSSAGVAEHLPVIVVPNLTRFLAAQKKKNFWVAGLDGSASDSLDSLALDHSLILVAGNEGAGMHRLVRETCDWLVRIPGNPQVGSLNVSNAVAVALYHLSHFF